MTLRKAVEPESWRALIRLYTAGMPGIAASRSSSPASAPVLCLLWFPRPGSIPRQDAGKHLDHPERGACTGISEVSGLSYPSVTKELQTGPDPNPKASPDIP